MADNFASYDLHKVFETVKIALILTDRDLNLLYANRFAKENFPQTFESGKKLSVRDFLQHEDLLAFENMVAECKEQGESISTFKHKGADKYFKVKAYYLKNDSNKIVFQFEDVSQLRILENQLYEHLIDMYNQLEAQEREIVHLRATILRSKGMSTIS